MRKRVLFVLKEYYPKPAPTGVCVQNVQKALFDIGIESDVLQLGDKEGYVTKNKYGEIFSIKTLQLRFDTTKRNIISFYIKKIPLILKWPIYSYKSIRKYNEWINNLKEKKKYDAIIGVALPVETVLACSKHDGFILYELDSIVNNPEYKRGIKKLYRFRLLEIEKKVYQKACLIIHLENNREYYSNNRRYEKYDKKTKYTDVPNLVKQGNSTVTVVEQNEKLGTGEAVKITYLGSLFPDYRSPDYIIKLLCKISETENVHCVFYSRGACEDLIELSEKEHPKVIKKGGYIEHSKVSQVIQDTDFLLSIGNKLTGKDYSLPSKVIEYIGAGKPIIHISGGENDSAIAYLKKYGLAHVIDPAMNFEENAAGLTAFLKEAKGKSRKFDELREIFIKNDPLFTANIINAYIEEA